MRYARLILLSLFVLPSAWAQTTADVYDILDLLSHGQRTRAENRAAPLLARQSEDPGVLYMRAMLARDGDEAVEWLSRIATEHRDSEWYDDALFRLHQYYLATGASNIAATYAARLRQNVPDSPLIVRLDNRSTTTAAALRSAERPSAQPLPIPELHRASSGRSDGSSPQTDMTPPSPRAHASSVSRAPSETRASVIPEHGPFTAEIRGLSSCAEVDATLSRLRAEGFTAELKLRGKKVPVIHIGVFPTRSSAERFVRRLSDHHHLNAVVVPK